jgi:hypothetical protein
MLADYRDESDFKDAIGIIGAGPIGGYTPQSVATNADGFSYIVAPMLDGETAQGFQVNGQNQITKNSPIGAPRWVLGTDPTDQSATDDRILMSAGGTITGDNRAAGTAFVELRATKSSAIVPSTPEQHSMQVPLDKGLSGWTWDQNGNRSATSGLTNPFWIAVFSFLRAIGLDGSNVASATQLANFVLSAVYKGDGTGAAEIADTLVNKLLGTGQQKQFQFQGILSQQKPFRDWLTEILSCCLGYYTFEFGQLKLGIRINASAVDAYTLGNILFQSLKLTPIEATFEKLIIDFADVAYQYQANTATYVDKTHAAYYGRAGSPLTVRLHSVGMCNLNQALLVAAVRTREEIGGINATEWRNARNAIWKTTLLGLNNEVGQVVSMTHPDVPSGYGDFRIQKWTLFKDWSTEIQAKTVTPSMYDMTLGPKPTDVIPAPLPPLFTPIPLGPCWALYQIQAPENDALFPSEYTFDSDQEYTPLQDGSVQAALIVTGKTPVNDFSPGVAGPVIGNVTVNPTGGLLPGGLTAADALLLSICAIDTNGLPSVPSRIAVVPTPSGPNTCQLVLSDITWPAVSNLASYAVFISTSSDLICMQQTGALTAAGNNTYTPGSITVNGPLSRSTYALPSAYVDKVRIKAKRGRHLGVAGVDVDSVNAPNQIVCSWLIDTNPPSNVFNPVGRILSVVGRPEGSTPYISFSITAFDRITGTLTLSPDVVTTGHPELSIQAGDVVVIRTKADAPNTSNPTQITDSGYQNITYNYTGLAAGAEVGNILRVIQGTGRGQLRNISGNTGTQISWDLPLVLDETSVWIIEEPAWAYIADSTSIDNADPLRTMVLTFPTDNFIDQQIIIAGFTVDISGNESPDGDVPIREDWIFGATGQPHALIFQAAGTLAITSAASSPLYLNGSFTAGSVVAYVGTAPTGAALTIVIYVGGTAWMTLTIPAGSTSVTATQDQINAAAEIAADTQVIVGITAVGTTVPGSNLSVFIYS